MVAGVVVVWLLHHKTSQVFEFAASLRPQFAALIQDHPVLSWLAYVCAYALALMASLPFAIAFMFLGGGLFGLSFGVLGAFAATTVAASFSFLLSRHLLRARIQRRYQSQLMAINRGIAEMGAYYLFSLRLVPLLPFSVLNLAMGLTSMPFRKFILISQVGMVPGIFLYVWGGTAFREFESMREVLSLRVLVTFGAIAVMPFIFRWMMPLLNRHIRRRREPEKPAQSDYDVRRAA